MWLMLSGGIIMPSLRPAHKMEEGELQTMQLRARSREHLSRWRREYQPALGSTIHIPKTDYEYRAYCTPESFALAFTKAIMDIDYTKFKPTTEDYYDDAELHRIYNRIWSVVLDANPDRVDSKYWHRTTGTDVVPWSQSGAGAWVGGVDDATGWATDGYDGGTTFEPDEFDELYGEVAEIEVDVISKHFDEVKEILSDIDAARPDTHYSCEHSDAEFSKAYCRRLRLVELRDRTRQLMKKVNSPIVLTK